MQSDPNQHSNGESPGQDGAPQRTGLFRDFLTHRPRTAYVMMLAAMVVSAVLAFTVMRREAKHQERESLLRSGTEMVGSSLDGLVSSASLLREVLELQSTVESFLAMDSLSTADSLLLAKALDRIHFLDSMHNVPVANRFPTDTATNKKSP